MKGPDGMEYVTAPWLENQDLSFEATINLWERVVSRLEPLRDLSKRYPEAAQARLIPAIEDVLLMMGAAGVRIGSDDFPAVMSTLAGLAGARATSRRVM
jgi:hypothetical protein